MFTTFLFLIASVSLADTWERTLDKAMPSIVMIRSYAPRSFDGTTAGSSYATGFVVDAERGIILTNRHVVRPGPVVAEAILLNNEELPLAPLYRDPVHDFGFFKYDPEAIRFHEMEPLILKPENARQGTEIRLAGSDAGEKISILAGTLARLDREAPSYGVGRYNDFNTFYFQAASSSSGGSSGSPVLDVNGYVVALNAGSNRRAASSFFLPLERVARALKLIQAGEPVPRGTIHTTLIHKTFDEAVRFGLSPEVEASLRKARPDAKGVLTVERVQLLGAAWERLEPGDILLSLGGEVMTEFIPVEAHLDGNVGKMVFARILRGGVEKTVALQVGDLSAVTPSEYLEIGNSILHTTSYQTARHYEMPILGAYVAKAGYLFNSKVERGEVITHINGSQIVDLDALISAVEGLADREIFQVHSMDLSEPHRPRVSTVKMDRRWFPAQRCKRVDGVRAWPCEALRKAPETPPVLPVNATAMDVQNKYARRLSDGVVLVTFRMPYRTNGVSQGMTRGIGVVVDAEEGLVLVARDTVAAGPGDVDLRFASSLEVDGEVVALHPQHSLALIRYDPKSIGDTVVSEVRFNGKPLEADSKVLHIGVTGDETVAAEEVTVAGTQSWSFPMPSKPSFRQVNLDYIALKGAWTNFGGVLADKRGRPSGLVASFSLHNEEGGQVVRTIPGDVVNAFLDDPSGAKRIGVELGVERLIAARDRGISDSRALELESHDKKKRQVLFVARVTRDGPADGVLEPGDIILSVNGSPATRMKDWNHALGGPVVDLVVFRGDAEVSMSITPEFISSAPVDHLLKWGGALFQAPYRAVAEQRGQPLDGVYVCYRWHGSPAGRFGLRPQRRVISVDGTPTPDLDAFSDAVVGKRSGEAVRVTTVDLKGRKRMITMEADTEYWPLVELVRTESGWERRSVHPEAGGDTDAAGGSDVHR